MDEKLIAPCGMNCYLCIAYQFRKNDINKRGFHKNIVQDVFQGEKTAPI